jgi:hypothetical protein
MDGLVANVTFKVPDIKKEVAEVGFIYLFKKVKKRKKSFRAAPFRGFWPSTLS